MDPEKQIEEECLCCSTPVKYEHNLSTLPLHFRLQYLSHTRSHLFFHSPQTYLLPITMDARPTQAPAVNEPTDRTDHNEVIAAINAIAHSPICALVIVYALETHETITQFFLSSSGIRVSLICFGVGVALESGHIWAGRRTKSSEWWQHNCILRYIN